MPRDRAKRLLAGRGRYIDDIVLPRMLHLAFVRSPYPRARIDAIDTVEAGTRLYEKELHKNHVQMSDIDLPLSVKIHVADSDEEAEKDAAPNAQWFYDALSKFLPGAPGRARPSNGYEEYPDAPAKVAVLAADDPWAWGACYGSPETVLKQMQAYSERVYTNHWMTWMRIGQLPHEKVMRSMELFAKEVIPKLKANG